MVTILPIDVDDNLVREGLQHAIAVRLDDQLSAMQKLVAELQDRGLVKRDEWHALFAKLVEQYEAALPVMEYAKCFDDQWPADDET